MKVRDVIRRLTDDGWVKVSQRGTTGNSSIQRSPVGALLRASRRTIWLPAVTRASCARPVGMRSEPMNVPSSNTSEVEQDRQGQINELAAEGGPDWARE